MTHSIGGGTGSGLGSRILGCNILLRFNHSTWGTLSWSI